MLFHPFHIHGYDFYVIEEGKLPNMNYHTPEAKAFVQQKLNENRYNLKTHLPMKDTVSVQNQGYSIMRIYTDNPGTRIIYICDVIKLIVTGTGGWKIFTHIIIQALSSSGLRHMDNLSLVVSFCPLVVVPWKGRVLCQLVCK